MERVGLREPVEYILNVVGLREKDHLFQLSLNKDRTRLKEALKELDEYSKYLDEEQFESFSIDSKQEYEGIGVTLLSTTRGIEIRKVFSTGPAENAGLLEGDIITHINGHVIQTWSFQDIVEHVRGNRGSLLQIQLIRDDASMEFTIQRGSIDIPSIRNIHLTKDGILYLKIEQFGEKTAREFIRIVGAHISHPLKGLIIDLRENTGGVFKTSLDLLDAFYKRGDVMLKTRNIDQDNFKLRNARHRDPLRDLTTIVLINHNSASASEIVAGSLQVTGKALLIGEQTLGKGSIQTVYSMKGGDGYKKTTGYYYLPDGSSIHKRGIIPDIEIELSPIQYREYRIREQNDIAPYETDLDPYWNTALRYLQDSDRG